MNNWKTEKIGNYIEFKQIKAQEYSKGKELPVYGVTNKEGITTTGHKPSKDLGKYFVIKEKYLAYNPYRINVGSIGLVPEKMEGLISPAYVVFKTKENKLLPELLLRFLKSPEGLHQIKINAGGSVRQALRAKNLCNIKMPVPPIEEQRKIINKWNNIEKTKNKLDKQITKQQTYIQKLRQQILQEAIQGKLTEEWRRQIPDVEPASELLKRIQDEKERLVKEGKIKKQKPLPPVKEAGKPFELPEGCVWCRLGEISTLVTDGKHGDCINETTMTNF